MLKVKNLNAKYSKFRLNDISLELPRGYVMGLIGENGAGKTTLIKLIMDLIRRESGEIEIFGLDNIKNGPEIREKIGFVYDETPFYLNLKVKEMTSIIKRFYPDWNDEKYNYLIDLFNIDESKKIKELSRGMSSKYMVATALSHNPDLIILDEPTSGIDPGSRTEILDLLREEIEDGNKSVLFSTHITTDLEKIADFITYLQNGEMIYTGIKDDFIDRYRLIKCEPNKIDDKKLKDFIGYKNTDYGFEGLTENMDLIQNLGKEAIIENPSIEEIMSYYKRGERIEKSKKSDLC
ncbi:MAG: ABC transporter ATP-binding protein [Tissierellia bacterium]|nr:ABC transporter ATP-binding protein [Tissierellia bacterium]